MAFKNREPKEKLLFHSDQGGNFTSRTFRMYLKEKGVEQSFSRAGMPYDNSVCESFSAYLNKKNFIEQTIKLKQKSRKE